jgi:hypothetical protein
MSPDKTDKKKKLKKTKKKSIPLGTASIEIDAKKLKRKCSSPYLKKMSGSS